MSLINNTSKLQELKEKIDALEKPENLTPTLIQQDNLILQIAAALEGKTGASGGASVDTCTVMVMGNSTPVAYTAYVYENDTFSIVTSSSYANGLVEIQNVVCGSIFVFSMQNPGDDDMYFMGMTSVDMLNNWYSGGIFQVTANKDEIARIGI